MTTWAVTGGSGFVGRHLIRRLLADGEVVRSLDVVPLDLAGAEAITGDVRDPDATRRLCRGADVLVHAAAALPASGSRRELRSVNVAGTQTVLDAARAAGVGRIVVVSSGVVYGLQRPPVGEIRRPAPIEPYGRTKVAAEALARAAGAVVLRPAAVVGPERLGLYAILFRWLDEGRRVYVLGSGRTRYQLLAARDLVEAIALAAEHGWPGETFNLGTTRLGTVREDMEELIRRAGSASIVRPLPARPARLVLAGLAAAGLSPLQPWHYRSAGHDVVLDVSRARSRLGWEPRSSNADALVAAYRWYCAHRDEAERGRTHRTVWAERALTVARRLS